MSAREIAVGDVPCLAVRVTYVGELGWELYCPTEYGAALWDALYDAGEAHGLRAVRLPRDRRAAAREGLPRVGRRHHARHDARRGRPRLRGEARQGRRLHRPRRGAARAARPARRAAAGAAWCSTTRARSRSARSRCAIGGEVVGRVTTRRLRLRRGRVDRLGLGARRARRAGHAARGRHLRRVGRRRGRAEPLYDPQGERIRS